VPTAAASRQLGPTEMPWADAWASFTLALRAENCSPNTIRGYAQTSRQFVAWAAAEGLSTAPARITRDTINRFIEHISQRWKPATAATRYRALHRFFQWLVDEGELVTSPMARMHAPRVHEEPPAVLSEESVRALLRACKGTALGERRDTALISFAYDTGMRLGEMAALSVDDIDPAQGTVRVLGKGRKVRIVPFGPTAAVALDRWLRARAKQSEARRSTALWFGSKGPMTTSGLRQAIQTRALAAGIGPIHPHQFRHTFSHQWISNGGSETDLMRIAGWSSTRMVARYGASAAGEP
jgi:site-specific recombinase XerD